MQKFRRFAQSLIGDDKYLSHKEESFGQVRSSFEKDQLDRKVREFEAAHPDIDLTAIYDNEKTEAARRTIHKKAYASYKAFHFLKNGVKRGKELATDEDSDLLSSAKKRLRDSDPYNFPELDQSVKSVLSSEIDLPQLNDAGDKISTPGRRINGYSQEEYLEAYFGKDMARRLRVESLSADPLYIEQKTMKEKFPLNSFLKMPQVLEKEEMLRKLNIDSDPSKYPYNLPKDDDMADWLRHRDSDDIIAMRRAQDINSDDELDDKSKTPAAEFDKILKDHHKFHSKKHYGEYKYFDSNFIDDRVEELEYKYAAAGDDDNEDWYELLRDPKVRRDDVKLRYIMQTQDERVDYINKFKSPDQ